MAESLGFEPLCLAKTRAEYSASPPLTMLQASAHAVQFQSRSSFWILARDRPLIAVVESIFCTRFTDQQRVWTKPLARRTLRVGGGGLVGCGGVGVSGLKGPLDTDAGGAGGTQRGMSAVSAEVGNVGKSKGMEANRSTGTGSVPCALRQYCAWRRRGVVGLAHACGGGAVRFLYGRRREAICARIYCETQAIARARGGG